MDRSREEEQLCLRQLVRTSKRRARIDDFRLSERPSHFSKSALRADITAHCLRQPRAMKRQPHAVYIGMRRTAVASSSCVQNALRCAPWARAQQQRTRSASSMGQHQQARQGSICIVPAARLQSGCQTPLNFDVFLVFFRGLEPKIFLAGLRPAPRWGSRPRPRAQIGYPSGVYHPRRRYT